jgi:5-methylcytosine-specific restriction endonuclease McrA
LFQISNPAYQQANSDAFLSSFEWRKVRMVALKKYGAKCQCCGATPATGAVMNVDHIKPRRFFPQLALDVNNLQILCNPCNHGKGSWDMTDWRPKTESGVWKDFAATRDEQPQQPQE